jgi:RNA polymerase sigma-70 factor (ECF subfamily)
MQDEGELVRRAASGNRKAFEALVRLKREQVVRIAYQITGEWEDAVDVSQGVFLRLWRGMGQYDPRRPFDTWLYRITVTAAIDLVRARAPRRAEQPLPELPAGEPASREPDAAAALDLAELQQAFQRLAGRLAPKQRIAFVLREIEGLDTAEVARIMDVTESTVRNHLLQARRILRAGLERDYPDLVPRSARGKADRAGALPEPEENGA